MKYANPNVAENLSNGFFVKLDPSTKVIDPVTHAKNKQPVKYRGVYGVRNLTVPFSVNARFKFKPGQSTPEVTTVHTMPVDNFLFNAVEVSRAITAQIKHCATTLHPDISEMLNWNVKLESNSLYNPLTGVTMAHVENAKIKDFMPGKKWSHEDIKKLAVDIWSLRCGLVKEIEIYAGIMLKYNVYGELTQYEMSADDYLDKVADVVVGDSELEDGYTPFVVTNASTSGYYAESKDGGKTWSQMVKESKGHDHFIKTRTNCIEQVSPNNFKLSLWSKQSFNDDFEQAKVGEVVELLIENNGEFYTRYAKVTGKMIFYHIILTHATAAEIIEAESNRRLKKFECVVLNSDYFEL